MGPGTQVTKTITLKDTRRRRYQTFKRNDQTPPLTYKKQGRIIWVDKRFDMARVGWADGTLSNERFENLEEI